MSLKNQHQKTYELFFSCSDLKSTGILGFAPDPLVLVFYYNPNTKQWSEIGRTETLFEERSPWFMNPVQISPKSVERNPTVKNNNNNNNLILNYENQKNISHDMLLRVSVFNVHKNIITMEHLIGYTECTFSELLRHRSVLEKSLLNTKGKQKGKITIRSERVHFSDQNIALQFHAFNLKYREIFGKPDTYFIIQRQTAQRHFVPIYRSPVSSASATPQWPRFSIAYQRLCNSDRFRPLRISIIDAGHALHRPFHRHHDQHTHSTGTDGQCFGRAVLGTAELNVDQMQRMMKRYQQNRDQMPVSDSHHANEPSSASSSLLFLSSSLSSSSKEINVNDINNNDNQYLKNDNNNNNNNNFENDIIQTNNDPLQEESMSMEQEKDNRVSNNQDNNQLSVDELTDDEKHRKQQHENRYPESEGKIPLVKLHRKVRKQRQELGKDRGFLVVTHCDVYQDDQQQQQKQQHHHHHNHNHNQHDNENNNNTNNNTNNKNTNNNNNSNDKIIHNNNNNDNEILENKLQRIQNEKKEMRHRIRDLESRLEQLHREKQSTEIYLTKRVTYLEHQVEKARRGSRGDAGISMNTDQDSENNDSVLSEKKMNNEQKSNHLQVTPPQQKQDNPAVLLSSLRNQNESNNSNLSPSLTSATSSSSLYFDAQEDDDNDNDNDNDGDHSYSSSSASSSSLSD